MRNKHRISETSPCYQHAELFLINTNFALNFAVPLLSKCNNSSRRIKRSQLSAPLAIVYCYLEFKLKLLTSFSIRVKELFEPIVLQTGFCSFQKHLLEKPIFEQR